MKRLAGLLVLALSVTSFAAAEEQKNAFSQFPQSLGAMFVVGESSYSPLGGLSYQRWMGPIGIEVLAGGMLAADQRYSYQVAATLQYSVYAADFSDWFSGALYALALAGHSGLGSTQVAYTPNFHYGVGIGIEMVFLHHLAPSIEFLYMGGTNPFAIGFGFGSSLRYRF